MRLITLVALVGGAVAQEPAAEAPLKRSLADGLVRQLIEREGLVPPRVSTGVELAAGDGPLVLAVRRPNGVWAIEELARGRGDHGPALKAAAADVPVEIEEGAPDRPERGPARLVLQKKGETIVIGAGTDKPLFRGPAIEPAAVKQIVGQLAAAVAGGRGPKHLLMQIDPDVAMQDVLAVWEHARAAGFDAPMFNGIGRPGSRMAIEEAEKIAAIPERFAWPVERVGPGGRMRLCSGELVVLLDGPTSFGAVEPLFRVCAQVGIWQIGFVGQAEAENGAKNRRFKLRANLPIDRGLLK